MPKTMEVNDLLMCHVDTLRYDFQAEEGELRIPDLNSCDMTGCLNLFRGISQKVQKITVFAGDSLDITYEKRGLKWIAMGHQ